MCAALVDHWTFVCDVWIATALNRPNQIWLIDVAAADDGDDMMMMLMATMQRMVMTMTTMISTVISDDLGD